MPNVLIKTYTHIPLVGVKDIIDEKGNKVSFQYDYAGRLIMSQDSQGNRLNNYRYQFCY